MGWKRVKFLALLALLMLLVATGCAPDEIERLEGILQNVDTINGEITMSLKDGRVVTLTIATDAPVETEGASSTLETLEPGASIEVEVNEDGQVVQHINARLAKAEGVVVEIDGKEITVETERGRRVTVIVTERTRIELEDDLPGTLADLHVGAEVEVKFDPDSRVAFKIDTEEEEAEIEGIIVEIDGEEVTVETERGRRLTLIISKHTRIELEDHLPGTLADLQKGVEVEVKFDPFTRTALKIGLEEEVAEIEGTIVNIAGEEVTIETESGRRVTLIVGDRTRIEVEDNLPGTLADLQKGIEVEVKFDSGTNVALKIELED